MVGCVQFLRAGAALAMAGAGLVALAPPASAAFPGAAGLIVYRQLLDADFTSYLFVQRLDGTGERQLTFGGQDSAPRWSPDGSRIAYVNRGSSGANVWTMRADGSDKRAVGTTGTDADTPNWSADGRRIVFAAGGDIFTVRSSAPYGTPVRVAGADRAAELAGPVFSPDGTRLAYVQVGVYPRIPDRLVVQDLRTGAREIVASTTTMADPTWLPDSSALAFSGRRYPSDSDRIFRVSPRAGSPITLVSSRYNDDLHFQPTWAPDGRGFCYSVLHDYPGNETVCSYAGRYYFIYPPGEYDYADSPDWRPIPR